MKARKSKDAKAEKVISWAIKMGYLARASEGCLTDRITITIGDRGKREIQRTPENIAMLEAVHHFQAAGRITADDVATHASASHHQVKVTKAMAADFLKLMFEPQSLDEVEHMLADLTQHFDFL